MPKNDLPKFVRYVKNGEHGKWWEAAKDNNQIHAGWSNIPADLLQQRDLERIKDLIYKDFADRQKRNGARQDFNALHTLLDRPSQLVWVTFQQGCMWWCTVHDGIILNKGPESSTKGHFWLRCDRPWSNKSINGNHLLTISDLPGDVAKTASHRATICQPAAWEAMLRIINDERNTIVTDAADARAIYGARILDVIRKMQPEDFEELIEQILDRTGWLRLSRSGGTRADVDIEAWNATADEKVFVQVKSEADQSVLDKYVTSFNQQREQYKRMIFAVHTPKGTLKVKDESPVQIWVGEKIADLVVRLGLGERVEKKVA